MTQPQEGAGNLNQHLIDEICALPGYLELFHPPYNNNWILAMARNTQSLEAHQGQICDRFAPLNVADQNFRRACKEYVQTLSCADPWVMLALADALKRWKDHFSNGTNLLCASCAYEVVCILNEVVEPAGAFLGSLDSRHPEVFDAFIQLPHGVRDAHRLNLAIPADHLLWALEAFFLRMSEGALWSDAVQRVEVAKTTGWRDPTHPGDHQVDFPTFIVYLRPDFVGPESTEMVAELVGDLGALLDERPNDLVLAAAYADLWRPNASASHGFRLYKAYLETVGILERVYAPQGEFAYLWDTPSVFPLALQEARLATGSTVEST